MGSGKTLRFLIGRVIHSTSSGWTGGGTKGRIKKDTVVVQAKAMKTLPGVRTAETKSEKDLQVNLNPLFLPQHCCEVRQIPLIHCYSFCIKNFIINAAENPSKRLTI